MNCPKCRDIKLKVETYEGIEIDRCTNCNGTWLDENELYKIIEIEEKTFSKQLIRETFNMAYAGVPKEEQRSKELCPKCNEALAALNYSYNSGVIIDRCPNDHGVWLDVDEVEKIQAYREECKDRAEEYKEDWLLYVKANQEAKEKEADEKRKLSMRPSYYMANVIVRKYLNKFLFKD